MRTKAWLVWLRLARLPPPASRVRRPRLRLRQAFLRPLRSQKQYNFVRWVQTLGIQRYVPVKCTREEGG